jgi:hypothetical protein
VRETDGGISGMSVTSDEGNRDSHWIVETDKCPSAEGCLSRLSRTQTGLLCVTLFDRIGSPRLFDIIDKRLSVRLAVHTPSLRQ